MWMSKRLMDYYRVACLIYVLFLMFVSRDFGWFTFWALLSQLIYWSPFRYSELCEIGYVHYTWAITWTVAVLISVVLAVDSTVLDEAYNEYGWVAHLVNIMEHYVTVFLLAIDIIRHPELNNFIGRKSVINAMLLLCVLGILYITFLHVDRYHVGLCLPLFASIGSCTAAWSIVLFQWMTWVNSTTRIVAMSSGSSKYSRVPTDEDDRQDRPRLRTAVPRDKVPIWQVPPPQKRPVDSFV